VLTDQSVRLLRAQGAEEEQLERVRTAHRALMEALLDDADDETLLERTKALIQAQTPGELPDAMLAMVAAQAGAQFDSPWFREFIEHDPAETIARVRRPVLACYGGLDTQVSTGLNAPPMAEALEPTHPRSRLVVFPGRNHLFQRARTGGTTEYALIEESIDDAVIEDVATWMRTVLDRRR